MTAGSPCGALSQAELTAERVITRCTTGTPGPLCAALCSRAHVHMPLTCTGTRLVVAVPSPSWP
jgi:hypothetical protein